MEGHGYVECCAGRVAMARWSDMGCWYVALAVASTASIVVAYQPQPSAPACPCPAAAGDAGNPAPQKARTVLAVSRAAYSACRTYADEGAWDTVHGGESHHWLETFRTAFAGPNRLRFTWGRGDQLIVSDAGVSDDGVKQIEHDWALARLIRAPAGWGTSVIPLLPIGLEFEDGTSTLDLDDPRAVGIENVDGETCDVVEGLRPRERDEGRSHRQVKMWISQRDHLVRRFTEDFFMPAAEVRVMNERLIREGAMKPRLDDAGRSKSEDDLSSFEVVIFHPRCNEPIAADASL